MSSKAQLIYSFWNWDTIYDKMCFHVGRQIILAF